MGDHEADLVVGVDLVALLDGVGGAQEEVVAALLGVLLVGDVLVHAVHHEVGVDVDLVDGEPVVHEALEAGEEHVAVALEGLERVAGDPAVVLVGQVQRAVKVVDGHEWLDAQLLALLEDVDVELDAFLVGLGVVAVGEDAGPVDGEAVDVAAHLRHQLEVLLPMVVEVGGHVAGVVDVGVDDGLGAGGDLVAAAELLAGAVGELADEPAGDAVAAVAAGQRVSDRGALAAGQVAALVLVCGSRAAPQKALGKTHVTLLVFVMSITLASKYID